MKRYGVTDPELIFLQSKEGRRIIREKIDEIREEMIKSAERDLLGAGYRYKNIRKSHDKLKDDLLKSADGSEAHE